MHTLGGLVTLDRIPDTVDPNSDPHWDYATTYQQLADGSFKDVLTGVRLTLKAAASYIAGDCRPVWESQKIGPRGLEDTFQRPEEHGENHPKLSVSRGTTFRERDAL